MRRHSIAVKLFLMIFSVYFSVTLMVSFFQILYVYNNAKKYIVQEITNLAHTFEDPIGQAVWSYDKERAESIISGMQKSPLVYGAILYDEHGGLILSTENKNRLYNIRYEQNIYFNDFGEKRYVGRIVVLSNSQEIFERIKNDLTLILTNAIIITAVLFILFFWVIKKYLLDYLSSFIRQIRELDPENLEQAVIDLKIKEENELKTLETSFNSLLRKLALSAHDLRDINGNLDKMVKERTAQLEILSTTDELTGLYNRRFYTETAERELKRCWRDKKSFTFAVIDVDDFKKYNDLYGHQKGDKALIAAAKAMKRVLNRGCDFLYRLGGEEFCIVTSGINREEVIGFMDSIRESVENLNIEHRHSSTGKYLTISVGVLHISGEKGCDLDILYKAADYALYQAKENGRNRVEALFCSGHNDEHAVCKMIFKE